MMAYVARPMKQGPEEWREQIHKTKITLSSENVNNLEKGGRRKGFLSNSPSNFSKVGKSVWCDTDDLLFEVLLQKFEVATYADKQTFKDENASRGADGDALVNTLQVLDIHCNQYYGIHIWVWWPPLQ